MNIEDSKLVKETNKYIREKFSRAKFICANERYICIANSNLINIYLSYMKMVDFIKIDNCYNIKK